MAAPVKKYVLNNLTPLLTLTGKPIYNSTIFIRHFARRLHRKPIRVIQDDSGGNPAMPAQNLNLQQNIGQVHFKKKSPSDMDAEKNDFFQASMQKSMKKTFSRFKLPDYVKYIPLEEGDKRFGPVVMAAKSKKSRLKENIILLEGKRLILDAIETGAQIKSIFFDKVENLEHLPFEDLRTDFYKVKSSHMRIWSDVTAPPGIMAVCSIPAPLNLTEADIDHIPVTLILDNIRDPGNMGTLLRTAAAVGCDKVITVKGCVDIWEPKVLRSGAGSHFKTSLIPHIGWEEVGGHLPENTFIALADNNNHEFDEMYEHKPSKEARHSLMKAITSIEPSIYTEIDEETGRKREVDETFLDEYTVKLFKNVPLSISSLFETDLSYHSHVTVIIGGETHGVSNAAKKLTFDKNGEKIYISMNGGVESLNAAIAGSVILFEVKRQVGSKMKRFTDNHDDNAVGVSC